MGILTFNTFSTKKEIAMLLAKLEPMLESLRNMSGRTDGLNLIVDFFNATSFAYDTNQIPELITRFSGVNKKGRHDKTIESLRSLNEHIKNSGRNMCGLNRTQTGASVSEEDVFLGDVYGLFTHPVAFWKKHKDEKKGGWGFSGMEHLNAYDVVEKQALQFVNSHLSMVSIADTLK